jgi:hypothetical protein
MNHSTNLSNTCVVEELDDELEDFEEIGTNWGLKFHVKLCLHA